MTGLKMADESANKTSHWSHVLINNVLINLQKMKCLKINDGCYTYRHRLKQDAHQQRVWGL